MSSSFWVLMGLIWVMDSFFCFLIIMIVRVNLRTSQLIPQGSKVNSRLKPSPTKLSLMIEFGSWLCSMTKSGFYLEEHELMDMEL